jgi:aryl-alcohol dehydrogenase-like predicted oxidoreductase
MQNKNDSLIRLGRTEVRVSPVGVGTNSWGVQRHADPEKQPTFDALLEAGINFFDTAEIYTMGASERTIGRCIAGADVPGGFGADVPGGFGADVPGGFGVGGRAAPPVILTKFFPLPWRLGKPALPAALKKSLERLQLPRVDVYLLHFPTPPVALETWADALADVVESGLARSAGISNCDARQTRRAHAVLSARGVPLACNEVEFSLLKRAPESTGLLSACRELEITLIAYRPLVMGVLSGKYTAEHPPAGMRSLLFGRRYLARLQPLMAAMARIGESHDGKSMSQVAINWVICKGALPIPGAKNEKQARENAGAMGWRLSEKEIMELEAAAGSA